MSDAFARILVDYVVAGGARVSWEMNRHFIDPLPHSFQLQFGRVGNPNADDWIDVGGPVVDTFFTFDLDKRLFGKEVDAFYRVKVTTAAGTYYSDPEQADGKVLKRDWLFIREMIRKERLRHSALTSVDGYLLKVRRYGPRCPRCTDTNTEEVQDTNCPVCYGTGYQYGYYDAMPNAFCELGLQTNRTHRDGQTGTAKQDVQQGRFVGDPQLYSYDVWIQRNSDERFYMQNIQQIAQHRGVNVAFSAELRLAPFSDIIYTFPIDRGFSPGNLRQQKDIEQWQRRPKMPRPRLSYLDEAFRELKRKRKIR